MANVTYYVGLPFIRTDDGELVAGEAQEHQIAAAAAVREAERMGIASAGASRSRAICRQVWSH